MIFLLGVVIVGAFIIACWGAMISKIIAIVFGLGMTLLALGITLFALIFSFLMVMLAFVAVIVSALFSGFLGLLII
jgi:hypothetical protein